MPVIIFDSTFRPITISNATGELLRINCKDNLENHTKAFKPIIDLLLNASSVVVSQTNTITPYKSLSFSAAKNFTQEICLECADKQLISVLVSVVCIASPNSSEQQESIFIAMLYDLSIIEPLITGLESIRRLRPFVVSTSCLTGKSFADVMRDSLNSHTYGTKTHNAIRHSQELSLVTDLQQVLNDSINIAEPMFTTATKLLVDVRSSALLAIQEIDARELFCYILLEAADFVSPHGIIEISAKIPKTTQSQSSPQNASQKLIRENVTAETYVNISVSCHKKLESFRKLGQIEQYILRRVFPKHYKARNSVTKDTKTDLETVSDNLKFACAIANKHKITLNLDVVKNDLLIIELAIPIIQTKGPLLYTQNQHDDIEAK